MIGADVVSVTSNGKNLRVLSPNNGMMMHPGDFNNYYESYVNEVWTHYTTQPLTIGAQAFNVSGQTSTSTGQLVLGGESFSKPSTADIFSSDSGPFATGTGALRNQIIPQLAAAFNRSTLLSSSTQPTPVSQFYTNKITNHFSRVSPCFFHAISSYCDGWRKCRGDLEEEIAKNLATSALNRTCAI